MDLGTISRMVVQPYQQESPSRHMRLAKDSREVISAARNQGIYRAVGLVAETMGYCLDRRFDHPTYGRA